MKVPKTIFVLLFVALIALPFQGAGAKLAAGTLQTDTVPPLPQAPSGKNDFTPQFDFYGNQIYPIFPNQSEIGVEKIEFSLEVPAEVLQTLTCDTLDNPFIDPGTWGDMDVGDNYSRLDVIYCEGVFYFRSWSIWAGRPPLPGDWNLQRLVLDWQLVNLTDNRLQNSGHLEDTKDPVIAGAPTIVEGQVALPVNGKTYRLDVVAYVRQLGCDNGSGQVSGSITQVAPIGSIEVYKTDQNGNPVPNVEFESWFRNKDGQWELGATKVTDSNGYLSFAAPQGSYKIVENTATLPFGSYPISPGSGETDEFVVDPAHSTVEVTFVNHVPFVLYLPIQLRSSPNPCTRQARLEYIDRTGKLQSIVRRFTPAGAAVFSIGVLPYGRVITLTMTDGQPVELMTIQSVTPAGGHYTYTDLHGPVWRYAGTWEWDKGNLPPGVVWRNVVDIHNFIPEYHNGTTLCVMNIQSQWDPPALAQLQENFSQGNLTPSEFYIAAAFLRESK